MTLADYQPKFFKFDGYNEQRACQNRCKTISLWITNCNYYLLFYSSPTVDNHHRVIILEEWIFSIQIGWVQLGRKYTEAGKLEGYKAVKLERRNDISLANALTSRLPDSQAFQPRAIILLAFILL